MTANRIGSVQNLVLMWRLYDYSCSSYTSTLMQCNACCKREKILGAVIPTSVEPRKNGDPERVQFSS